MNKAGLEMARLRLKRQLEFYEMMLCTVLFVE